MDRNKRQEERRGSPSPLATCSRAIRTGTNGPWELIEGGRGGKVFINWISMDTSSHNAVRAQWRAARQNEPFGLQTPSSPLLSSSSSGLPCTPRGETHLISSTFSATSMHMDERKRCHHESRYVARHQAPPPKKRRKKKKKKEKNHDPLLL